MADSQKRIAVITNEILTGVAPRLLTTPSPQPSSLQDSLLLPVNDLGLLAGLTVAYASPSDGTWSIRKALEDSNDSRPDDLYLVTKKSGVVTSHRKINDWYREPNSLNDISPKLYMGEITNFELTDYIPEKHLRENITWDIDAPFGYEIYLRALHELARKRAEQIQSSALDIDVSDEQRALRIFAWSNRMRFDGLYLFATKPSQKEAVQSVPLDQFDEYLSSGMELVGRIDQPTTTEGQAKPPGREKGF